jgi:tetraacyldisaccharide 4'-kinase
MRARRWWGWPLVPIYAVGLAMRDGLRRVGLLQSRRLAWPVISVGSLSAGGAGKTPVVITLAELLKGRGWNADVLSRGYGRSGRGVERIDLTASDAAERFGDEPVMIAQRTGVPVWVGAERFAAGVAAESAEGEKKADSSVALRNDKEKMLLNDKQQRVHLLDDGFQHRGLARAVDVVLLTEADLDDALLPAGNRRERLAALRRADVVVLREQEWECVESRVRGLIRADAVMWRLRRELRFTVLTGAGSAGDRPMAFCAIARPWEFWRMLEDAGCRLAERIAFADHHAYSMDDMVRMVASTKNCGATGFLTTEKDAVKLDGAMLKRLGEVGPVCVVGLEAKFADEMGVLRDLEARCR